MIECEFEHKKKASLRHTVVDAVIIMNDEILLTKRAKKLRGGDKWAVPGGFMERDETAVECVMREVLEETGYTCEVKDLITILDDPNRKGDDRQNISFVFLVNPIKQVKEPDKKEVSEVKWFKLDKLPAASDMAFDHLEIIWEYIKNKANS